jgi:DNA-directed RNA polymerase
VAKDFSEQPVNKSKQNSAFPPNFVHSIDSTHMMFTAQECKQKGISFAAVHDSFWTHAADVDRMNGILRNKFIELHSSPLITNLHDNFVKRYPQQKFPRIPTAGDFDLSEIRQSTYFFS